MAKALPYSTECPAEHPSNEQTLKNSILVIQLKKFKNQIDGNSMRITERDGRMRWKFHSGSLKFNSLFPLCFVKQILNGLLF
jgi:hypothetical protein